MNRSYNTINSSYMKQRSGRRKKMVGFLKLGSCRVLVGRKNPNTIVAKRHKILFITAAVILVIGLLFVIY